MSAPTGRSAPHLDDWCEPVPRLREPRYSQSLERGLAILECFDAARPVWGIAELAQELGMSRSTTHRYALTLTELGYLVRAPGRRYRLGLAAVGSTSLREHAQPHLEELARRAPYTLTLGVLDGSEVLWVACVHGSRRWLPPPELGLAEGARVPLHCTAAGRLLAARLSEPERREALAGLTLRRRGPRTVTTRAALLRQLAALADATLARGTDELGESVDELTAPVRDIAGEVRAAVSMTAHRSIVTAEQLADHVGPHLIVTVDRISAQLGYRRGAEQRAARTPAAG